MLGHFLRGLAGASRAGPWLSKQATSQTARAGGLQPAAVGRGEMALREGAVQAAGGRAGGSLPDEFLHLTDLGVVGDLVGEVSASASSLWFWSVSDSSLTDTSEPAGTRGWVKPRAGGTRGLQQGTLLGAFQLAWCSLGAKCQGFRDGTQPNQMHHGCKAQERAVAFHPHAKRVGTKGMWLVSEPGAPQALKL